MPALDFSFLWEEMGRKGLTLPQLEEITGIPDATLSRILNNGVTDGPKAYQLAKIARGLGLKFWYVMQRAGYDVGAPDEPSGEAQRLAAVFLEDPELSALLHDAEPLDPRDRDAVRAYIADLQRRRKERQTRHKLGPGHRRKSSRQSSPED